MPRGGVWQQPAALPQRWLVFSDLHVSHRTRGTCMAVLERVHEEAARRAAGILFLGGCWCRWVDAALVVRWWCLWCVCQGWMAGWWLFVCVVPCPLGP